MNDLGINPQEARFGEKVFEAAYTRGPDCCLSTPLAPAEGPPGSQETQERFAEVAVGPVFVQSLADSLEGHREISARCALDLSY